MVPGLSLIQFTSQIDLSMRMLLVELPSVLPASATTSIAWFAASGFNLLWYQVISVKSMVCCNISKWFVLLDFDHPLVCFWLYLDLNRSLSFGLDHELGLLMLVLTCFGWNRNISFGFWSYTWFMIWSWTWFDLFPNLGLGFTKLGFGLDRSTSVSMFSLTMVWCFNPKLCFGLDRDLGCGFFSLTWFGNPKLWFGSWSWFSLAWQFLSGLKKLIKYWFVIRRLGSFWINYIVSYSDNEINCFLE